MVFHNYFRGKEEVEMSADIGKLIKLRRKELHMTQAQLAEKIGLADTGSISTYECDKVSVNADMLKSLSNVLGVPVSYFFGETSECSSDEEKELINIFRIMDKDTRKKALDIIKILCA